MSPRLPGARGARTAKAPAGRAAGTSRADTYTDAFKTSTLRTYSGEGLAAAARTTGVPKSTIRRWAAAAGVEAAAANAAAAERTAEATAASEAARREQVAKAREQLVTLQAQIAVTASAAELEYLGAYREAVASAKGSVLGAVGAVQMARLQAAMSGPRLSELVGAKTRAIHDLQLLDGQATEQPVGGLVVTFATPAPTALSDTITGTDMRILELPAAPATPSDA